MAKFSPIDRATPHLLHNSVEEWMRDDNVARFVVEAVQQLDLSTVERAYRVRIARRCWLRY